VVLKNDQHDSIYSWSWKNKNLKVANIFIVYLSMGKDEFFTTVGKKSAESKDDQ
jgi:hypothetical protein